MDKNKNKGLADNQEGEFILNESGTSVTVDAGVGGFRKTCMTRIRTSNRRMTPGSRLKINSEHK